MEKSQASDKSKKSGYTIDTTSDGDFNSIYGSDVESLPGYEESQPTATLTLIAWTNHTKSTSSTSPAKQSQTSLCVVRMLSWYFNDFIDALPKVCGVMPQFSKRDKHYPTCGLTCAAKLEATGGSTSMCVVSALSLSVTDIGHSFVSEQVCGVRPSYSKGGKKYPTCGLSCADKLKVNGAIGSSHSAGGSRLMCTVSFILPRYLQTKLVSASHPVFEQVCGVRPSYSKGGKKYPTCSLSCADKLKANSGSYPIGGSGAMGGSRLMCVVSFIPLRFTNRIGIGSSPRI